MKSKEHNTGLKKIADNLLENINIIWSYVMSVEHSSLKRLDPIVGHMLFQCLAFIWSGLFAAMLNSYIAFGISATIHGLFISGIVITAAIFRTAEKNPAAYEFLKNGRQYSSRGFGGEHE